MVTFQTIEEGLEALKNGGLVLVTDDPDRENEGDLICAAQYAITENVNFMATYGKGLICMPMTEEYVKKLQIPQMVHHRDFCRRTVCNCHEVCGRGNKAGRFPPSRPHVSSAG